MKRRVQGATTATQGNAFGRWLTSHVRSFKGCIREFKAAPLAIMLTCAVIGITLALPVGLYVLLENTRDLTTRWESPATVSVFLRENVSDDEATALGRELEQRADIKKVDVKTRALALEEYQALSGLDDLAALFGDENPLPAVLVVEPSTQASDAVSAETLRADLAALAQAEGTQLDTEWLQRLGALVEVLRRGLWVLAGLLAVGVALVVGNTIGVSVNHRRDEIEISKLLGATNGFIRRPFLYSGLLYGLLGAATAALIVWLSLVAIASPVESLAVLYGSSFSMAGLSLRAFGYLLLGGALLGLFGAWLAVQRHLLRIEPTRE